MLLNRDGGLSQGFRLDRLDALLVSVLIITYIAVYSLPFSPRRYGDANFHQEAKAISMAIRGAAPWSAVVISKAPAPSLYYTVPYLLVPPASSDDTYWFVAVLWNVLWMLVSVLLLRRAGQWMASPPVGAWAALLTVVSPFGVYYSYGVNAEAPAFTSAVILASGWARWRAYDSGRPIPRSASAWCSWCGLTLLLLTRPNAVLLLGVSMGAGVMLWRRRTNGARREAAFAVGAVTVAGSLFALAFWLVTLIPGGWQEGNLSHVVLQGRFQFRTEPWDWRFWQKAYREGSNDHLEWTRRQMALKEIAAGGGRPLPEVEWRWMREDVLAHPILTLRMTGTRVLALQIAIVGSQPPGAFRLGPLSGRVVFWLFHLGVNAVQLGILAAVAVFGWKRRHNLASFWPLWGPWLALLVFHAVTYSEPRYLFPGRAGLALMAAAVLDATWLRLRFGRHAAGEGQDA